MFCKIFRSYFWRQKIMAEGVIPNSNRGRLAWAENMELRLPSFGAELGFSAEQIDAVIADCRMMRFVILNAWEAKTHSKVANNYKRAILGNRKTKAALSPPPAFTPIELPDVITMSGVLKRLQNAAALMKLSANYSSIIGEQLRIVSSKGASFSPDAGKPKAKSKALINSVVRLDWIKGKFHGVFVESQRGGETTWTRLDTDTRSPYIDARPPLEAGKPEERRYRLRYLLNDKLVGEWSDTIIVITKP